ncbi:MAG: ABC transporter permease [Acidimicrobiia bacterium]|nr:ABC transporter permease [Acidimicrobiia bacterium]
MKRYVTRQLIGLVVLLLVSSVVIFGVLTLASGDPLAALLGNRTPSPERVAQLQAQYHLNEPFLVQYWLWLTDAFRGDFGDSIVYQTPVSSLLRQAAPISIALILMAEAMIVAIGLCAAVVAARHRGAPDAIVALASSLAISIPIFVFAVLLTIIFGKTLGVLPTVGAGTGGWDRFSHLLLPAFALAIGSSALLARVGRSAMREEIDSPHVATEVARGIPSHHVFRRHVFRNSLPPLLAVIALQIPALIAGTVVVERAFNLGGIGTLLLAGVNAGDFPLVQAIALLIVIVTVTLGVLVDILHAMLDPRMSLAGNQ